MKYNVDTVRESGWYNKKECRNYEIDNLKYRKKTGEFYYEMYWYYRSNGS